MIRPFLLLLLFSSLSSNIIAQKKMSTYDTLWKKVEQLWLGKDLPESALKEVQSIYTKAVAEGNHAQQVKALLYMGKLTNINTEDAAEKQIALLDKNLQSAKEPVRSLLHSLIATTLWQYYQENQWSLGNRTPQKTKGRDIATWAAADFRAEISGHFLASLEKKAYLQGQQIAAYGPIIISNSGKPSQYPAVETGSAQNPQITGKFPSSSEQSATAPTLYDLLAQCALEFFQRTDIDYNPVARIALDQIAAPELHEGGQSTSSYLQDPLVFSPAAAFSKHPFLTADTTLPQFHALRIYQDLLTFHQKDKQPDALIETDIKRLIFARSLSELENKDKLYGDALLALESMYPSEPAAAQCGYLRMQSAYELAMQQRDDFGEPQVTGKADSNLLGLPQIARECKRISTRFPKSEGGLNAAQLLQQLERKSFSLTTEKVNSPGQPFRMLVNYANISFIHYRVVAVPPGFLDSSYQKEDQFWNRLKSLTNLKSIRQELPATNDLRTHRVELRVDAMEPGFYAILASMDEGFSLQENALAAQFFYVSSIAYIQRGEDFFTLDRETGKPLDGASVTISTVIYDYSQRKNKTILQKVIRTNQDGYFKLPVHTVQNTQFLLDLRYGKDRLALRDREYYYAFIPQDARSRSREDFEKKSRKLSLFTDRGIYRPGQSVHFKGILVARDYDTKRYKILPNQSTTIYLHNTEGEAIDSLKLTTNEFGSYTGHFRIPETVITGSFSIEDAEIEGVASFRVEEYKRPTFQVNFASVNESVRLDDTIRLNGLVQAYAGNMRNGAEVVYRVTRMTRFPYPWLSSRYFPRQQTVYIAYGKVFADAQGIFTIAFKAVPDRLADASAMPVFDFQVSVDVTDQGGETRSAETIVHAGYHAVDLSAQLDGKGQIPVGKDARIQMNARNLNGKSVEIPVEIRVFPLQQPQRLIRPRLWAAPDQFVMTEKEFIASFPHDEYKQEYDLKTWPKGKEILLMSDSIKNGSRSLALPTAGMQPGWYKVELRGKDIFGQEVRTETLMRILANSIGQGDVPHYLSTSMHAEQAMPVKPPAKKQAVPEGHQDMILSAAEPGTRVVERITTTAEEIWVIRNGKGPEATAARPQRGKPSPQQKTGQSSQAAHVYQVFQMTAGSREFPITIAEEDRGGYMSDIITIKHNRIFTGENTLEVPWSNKKLDIALTTFRQKTEPGAQEKWTVQVKGPGGEKAAAEILTSMYDASLDQFSDFQWNGPDWQEPYLDAASEAKRARWDGNRNFQTVFSRNRFYPEKVIGYFDKRIDRLIWQDRDYFEGPVSYKLEMTMAAPPADGLAVDSVIGGGEQNKVKQSNKRFEEEPMAGQMQGVSAEVVLTKVGQLPSTSPLTRIRKDFRETVYFLPQLQTDSSGSVSFSFTMPDALTSWKAQILAHTRDLSLGYAMQQIVTQKELMVQPNAPRFLRESDQLVFPARITNMSSQEVSGQAELQVIDAETGQVVDGLFNNLFPVQYFTAGPNQGTVVQFPLQVPGNFSKPVTYRIIAKTNTQSDGEEQMLPVLSNRMLVTESMPFFQQGADTKTYSFTKLHSSAQSRTLTNHAFTLEISTNPAWYALKSLPYLTGFPYDCSEQVFNRFYANALASGIAESRPELSSVFKQWESDSSGKSLQSNLEKNPALKNILLQETPWVLDAQKQSDQMREMARLFDETRTRLQLNRALTQLETMQSANGGFVWFAGGPDNRYLTQYIVAGLGKLNKTGTVPEVYRTRISAMTARALSYMDERLEEDLVSLKKEKADLKKQQIGHTQIQYLYAASFYPGREMKGSLANALQFYVSQGQQYWTRQSPSLQAMLAIALRRGQDGKTPPLILASLKETAVKNEELGMYWKAGSAPWRWQDAEVETQSLIIEAFAEISQDAAALARMKQWLLTKKQTTHWPTTRSTADACYALLLRGSNWLTEDRQAKIQIGPRTLVSNQDREAGTGYQKWVIPGNEVMPEMGNISVTIHDAIGTANASPAWGSAYWQYFENLENISSAGGPLQVAKKLYRSVDTDKGPLLQDADETEGFVVGDKLVVRLEIRADRDLEFVHLKDMRASGTEPVNVLSGYKYQGALGYYESTRDAATNFFFERMPRGTYVFEYSLFISQEGSFSTGPATIQCMYAPEFTAHSEGVRLKVRGR